MRLDLLLKRRHRKFTRIPSKYSAQPPPHLCSMERHLISQRHQRGTGLPYSQINALKRLLKLDAARAHRSNRESRARFRHLARQQYYRLTHCTRS